MKITKELSFRSTHIVRNCSTERCSNSIHGHTYRVLITLKSQTLDNADMVYDFGLFKSYIKKFINTLDESVMINNTVEKDNYKALMYKISDNVILLDYNPSAEMISNFIFKIVQKIINKSQFNNKEGLISLDTVEVYETLSGKAICREVLEGLEIPTFLNSKSQELVEMIMNSSILVNNVQPQQYK